jgi:anti-sigma B factor antagonist
MNPPADPPDDNGLEIDIDGSTLHVRGEIDAHSAPALGNALRAGSGSLDLDLAGVEFVDSSGLRILIESHQLLEARGDRLTIVDPSPAVQRMFELSVVDDYLNIRHG